jgi:hypothetical protein
MDNCICKRKSLRNGKYADPFCAAGGKLMEKFKLAHA